MRPLSLSLSLLFAAAIPACGDAEPSVVDGGVGGQGGAAGQGGNGGTGGGAGGGGGGMAETRYLPLKVGATWKYRVTTPGSPAETKTSTVLAFEDVGGAKAGRKAFKVETLKGGGGKSVSWQESEATRVIRHRELSFDAKGVMTLEESWAPYKLRVDESPAHTTAAATWTETYKETQIPAPGMTPPDRMDRWKVEAAEEMVTVPAGSFACLKVSRMGLGAAAGSAKTYWFAKGVGKVKETGGQTEELESYKIP